MERVVGLVPVVVERVWRDETYCREEFCEEVLLGVAERDVFDYDGGVDDFAVIREQSAKVLVSVYALRGGDKRDLWNGWPSREL
jgi:hypothetical protein